MKVKATQEAILIELARVYDRLRKLLKGGIEYADKMDMNTTWSDIEKLVVEYYTYSFEVVTLSLIKTYKQSRLDAYRIMQQIPVWKRKDVDLLLKQQAELKNSDDWIKHNILEKPWCADGKLYPQRLWRHSRWFFQRMFSLIQDVKDKKKEPEWLDRELKHLVQAHEYDLARLVKTETMAVYNKAKLDTYLEAGVEFVQIVGDAVCGGICLDYVDGDIIPLAYAELNDDLPPYHPNCACSFVDIVEFMPIKEALEYDEPENLSL